MLLFDPEATLGGIEKNLDFMADHTDTPFNFCRAEVYAGTPLKGMLEPQGRLRGDYLAWTYEMRDPRVELLFRIATTAFYGRNFKPDGLANLNMGIRFDNEVAAPLLPRGLGPGLARAAHGVLPGRSASTRSSACGERSPSSREVALHDRTEHPLLHPRSGAGRGPGGSGSAGRT